MAARAMVAGCSMRGRPALAVSHIAGRSGTAGNVFADRLLAPPHLINAHGQAASPLDEIGAIAAISGLGRGDRRRTAAARGGHDGRVPGRTASVNLAPAPWIRPPCLSPAGNDHISSARGFARPRTSFEAPLQTPRPFLTRVPASCPRPDMPLSRGGSAVMLDACSPVVPSSIREQRMPRTGPAVTWSHRWARREVQLWPGRSAQQAARRWPGRSAQQAAPRWPGRSAQPAAPAWP
jgi:hypothetical protein